MGDRYCKPGANAVSVNFDLGLFVTCCFQSRALALKLWRDGQRLSRLFMGFADCIETAPIRPKADIS